jgi:serine/threonine-protein kinase
MRGELPARLVNLLERLRLASATQIDQVAPRVRRLAGELPDFESVWVDALMQARVLTPLQAAEINAGHGESLVCGPFVIASRVASPHFAECFAATHLETARRVRLYRVLRPQVDAPSAVKQLQRTIEQLAPLVGPASGIVQQVGLDGDAVWAACSWLDGVTAAEWMSEYGRFPTQVVLHIAREMSLRLTELETLGVIHSDVGCAGLLLDRSGHVMLPMPGLRGAVRPSEGYSFDDLPVEAYDYLSPERVADGGPPTVASDLYACGCVWWHLLTGRAPFAGGNSLSKLKAVHAARLADVRQIAPDVPDQLCRAIEWCTMRDPAQRPNSIGEVRQLLGAPTRGGPALLARSLQGEAWLWQHVGGRRGVKRAAARKRRLAVTAAAGFLCFVAACAWQIAGGKRPVEHQRVAAAAAAKAPTTAPEKTATAEKYATTARSPARQVINDPAVTPTAAIAPHSDPLPNVLMLAEETPAGDLHLRAGQVVRSELGRRAVVLVSGDGLSVDCEDVSFEGVDFVWRSGQATKVRANRPPSIVSVAAGRARFQGCSFSTPHDLAPVAVAWHGPADKPADDGELLFRDCVFRGVQAAVDCAATIGMNIELTNTLCVAAGPIVRLPRPITAGRSLAIALDHVTTRGDCALLECRYGTLEDEMGAIVIAVDDSALVTNPRGALLTFIGEQRPTALLRAIAWNGQGSLVTGETAVAKWRDAAGRDHVLAEDSLEIGGLVRSEVTFAGAAHEPPSASRITRWNAPVQSDTAPGCDTSSLRLPENRTAAE